MTVSLLALGAHKGALLWAAVVLQPPRRAPSSCSDLTGATCFRGSAETPGRQRQGALARWGEPARRLSRLGRAFGPSQPPSYCLIICSLLPTLERAERASGSSVCGLYSLVRYQARSGSHDDYRCPLSSLGPVCPAAPMRFSPRVCSPG